jgi:hypothetical protein
MSTPTHRGVEVTRPGELDLVQRTSRATTDRDVLLEPLVAELTSAAYHVALRYGAGTWLDLQLHLWHALADTVEQWARKSVETLSVDEEDIKPTATLSGRPWRGVD